MVRDAQIINKNIVYQCRVKNDQVEGVYPNMCADINMLSRVKTVQYMGEFCSKISRQVIHVDIHISKNQNIRERYAEG